MDDVIGLLKARPKSGVPIALIQQALDRMEGYHRERIRKAFRAALAIDIRPMLTEPAVHSFMIQKVGENVDLIKTIPERFHSRLKANLAKDLQEHPFDQQRLKMLLQTEYRSSGYNLRRLTRDQTNKTIGGLTEIRHGQLGIEKYQWLTSGDERVRETHVNNSGLIFDWANPPSETGHPGEDIQCRCVPIPIISHETRGRLTGSPI